MTPGRDARQRVEQWDRRRSAQLQLCLSEWQFDAIVKLLQAERARLRRVVRKYQRINDSFTNGRRSGRACRAGYSLACDDILAAWAQGGGRDEQKRVHR